jgi:hypothetical protein
VRRVRLHAHDHVGLHARIPEVDVARLVRLQPNRDLGVRIPELVPDDRVGRAELGAQLVVVGEVHEQLADRVVDVLGVLEVGQGVSPPGR